MLRKTLSFSFSVLLLGAGAAGLQNPGRKGDSGPRTGWAS